MPSDAKRLEDEMNLPMPGDDHFHLTIKFLLDQIYSLGFGLELANAALRRLGEAPVQADAAAAREDVSEAEQATLYALKSRWGEMFDPNVDVH